MATLMDRQKGKNLHPGSPVGFPTMTPRMYRRVLLHPNLDVSFLLAKIHWMRGDWFILHVMKCQADLHGIFSFFSTD